MRAKRRRLLLGAATAVMIIVGIVVLEAEHRSKLFGLWPLLLFVPIPLLTWLNYRREDAKQTSAVCDKPKPAAISGRISDFGIAQTNDDLEN